MSKNIALEIFRLKAALIMRQWAERMKVFVVENNVAGLSPSALKDMRNDPKSRWAGEREKLNKELKREVAGTVNRIHFQAYMGGIKGKGR
jgi:hypothetical protein